MNDFHCTKMSNRIGVPKEEYGRSILQQSKDIKEDLFLIKFLYCMHELAEKHFLNICRRNQKYCALQNQFCNMSWRNAHGKYTK